MFGSKKLPDDQWAAEMAEVAATIQEASGPLMSAARMIGNDPISGWVGCREFLSNLDALKAQMAALKQKVKVAGEPASERDLKQARNLFLSFFDSIDLAVHWGKLHLKDASGGPGLRATVESGFAGRAATMRVTNNGMQFAKAALKAAQEGSLAANTVQAHSSAYRSGIPTLGDLFVGATGINLARDHIPASEVAMVAAWCFKQSAILGMLLTEAPRTALPAIWDPSRAQVFVQRVQEWSADLLASANRSRMLSLGFLAKQFPGIYADELQTGETFERAMKRRTEAAQTKASVHDAHTEWSIATAMGYGLGALNPDVVMNALSAEEEESDEAGWRQALGIPAERPRLSAQNQINSVIDVTRPYLREHCPEAFAAIQKYG